ncbi:11938_t:CDS:1, partial [Cetraspora pellucida]
LTKNSQAIQDRNWFLKTGLGQHTLANMMNDIACVSKININNQQITNHSGRRTAIQLLSDLNVNKYAIIKFSSHCLVNGLRSYKVPNNEQWLKNTTLLINSIQESQVQTLESQVQIRESQVETLESQVETPESQFQTLEPQVYISESQKPFYHTILRIII